MEKRILINLMGPSYSGQHIAKDILCRHKDLKNKTEVVQIEGTWSRKELDEEAFQTLQDNLIKTISPVVIIDGIPQNKAQIPFFEKAVKDFNLHIFYILTSKQVRFTRMAEAAKKEKRSDYFEAFYREDASYWQTLECIPALINFCKNGFYCLDGEDDMRLHLNRIVKKIKSENPYYF